MNKKGFTLIEVIVGSALFLVVAIAFYSAFVSLFQLAQASQTKLLAIDLADQQFEVIRNMPYLNVGLTNGIPQGVLPQTQTVSEGGIPFTVTLVIRSVNLSTSTVQASSKLVEVDISCPTCKNFTPVSLTGQVAPANLQSAGNGGALVVQAFDSNGLPVEGAQVNVTDTASSTISDSDVTDVNGLLDIIGVATSTNAYHIVVTKSGYSTDQTYPLGGAGNPNPTKPDATVLGGQVTQDSFSIDKLSTLDFSSVTSSCTPVPNYHFIMTGAKQIGAGVPKYSQNLTTLGGGALALNDLEWDTYTITPNDSVYDIAGITPFSPISLNPNNSQSVQLVVAPKDPDSLLVAVEDSGTELPLTGATVELTGPGSYDQTQTTGEGYIDQTDWSGGPGQSSFVNPSQYFADDGNVDTSTTSGSILLKEVFGLYDPSGRLESSTFDLGSASNFYSLSWKPANQPILAGLNPVGFQFATNATVTPTTTWSYTGPDGTANTYYTVPGSPISSNNNGNEFARYMAYFSTQTATVTPQVSDVSFTYTSSCTPPGQVLFQGLTAGSYTLIISKTGYTTSNTPVTVNSSWQSQTIQLGP